MTPSDEAQAMFRAYAMAEGAWHTPAWLYAMDLTAHPVDPRRLRANIVKAIMEPENAA